MARERASPSSPPGRYAPTSRGGILVSLGKVLNIELAFLLLSIYHILPILSFQYGLGRDGSVGCKI